MQWKGSPINGKEVLSSSTDVDISQVRDKSFTIERFTQPFDSDVQHRERDEKVNTHKFEVEEQLRIEYMQESVSNPILIQDTSKKSKLQLH